MKEGLSNINQRTFVWIFIVVLFLVVVLVAFQQMDKKRKYNQFESLHEQLISSEYPARFAELLRNFDPSDSVLIRKLGENISLLENDMDELDAILFISGNKEKYTISSNDFYSNSFHIKEINYFPDNIRNIMNYINEHGNRPDERLFNLAKGDNYIGTMIKLDSAYLWVEKFRH